MSGKEIPNSRNCLYNTQVSFFLLKSGYIFFRFMKVQKLRREVSVDGWVGVWVEESTKTVKIKSRQEPDIELKARRTGVFVMHYFY